MPIFNWTSCFLGAHVGGGWAHKNFTDPVALVQNSILGTVTTGVTTVGVSSSGLIIGGQMGCDYQFGFSPWVLGVEGAVSGANLRGNTNVVLPLGGPGDIATLTAKTDFLPSVTARARLRLGPWLLYVRAGGAWAGDKYSVTGTFSWATAFGFEGLDNRFGWTGRRRRGMGVRGRLVGEARIRLLRAGPPQRADDRCDQRAFRRAERAAERSDRQTRREFSHVGGTVGGFSTRDERDRQRAQAMTPKRKARRPDMKVISLRSALPTAILAIAFVAAAHVDSAEPADRLRAEAVASKVEYCTDCHGLSGQGYHGYLTMPRLAGQQPEYIENQLRNFAERSRDRDLFINMSRVHGLSPDMRSALAAHFRGLDPRPIGGGPRNLVGTGQKLFEEGIPEANIPACSACHGPDAKGQETIPRLAGQLYAYTVKQLTNWSKERGQGAAKDDTSAVMTSISHNLTPPQIDAIAAYLSYLR